MFQKQKEKKRISIHESKDMASFLFALLLAWIHWFDSPAHEQGLRGILQQLPSSLLEVHISEVSIQKGTVAPFDKYGCPSTTGSPSVIKYYAVVKYIIHNSGNDFSPAPAYKGEAGCHKPAIFNFLNLEGLIPSVKFSKHATCVVDDELADGKDVCASSSSNSMTIRSGKSFGSFKRAVSVKFVIEESDFATLYNTAATTKLDLKLSVNPLISPSVSSEVSVLIGTELGSFDWFNPSVFPAPVVLYSAPTTQTPTLSPTISTLSPSSAQPTTTQPTPSTLSPFTPTTNNHPISSDSLFAKYSASTAITGGRWLDISGNQNHATASGRILAGTDEYGTPIITGDTSTFIEFPVGGIGREYTIIYRAKYNGPFKQRILTSIYADADPLTCNWLSGFWGGGVGIAHHGGWITDYYNTYVPVDQWLVSTDQLNLYRGNGVNYMKYQPSTCVFTNLGINLFASERSNWAVSDVIIYSRELSLSEIQTVEASLTPSAASTLSPTTTNSPTSTSSPTSSDRLLAKYSASTAITEGIWPDISGNQNHATVSGTVLTGTDEFGTPIITGDPSTFIEFPVGGIGREYTIIYRAKYNGPNKKRILTSMYADPYITSNHADPLTCNWLSGFWDGKVGIAHHGGWITDDYNTYVPVDQWLVSTDQLNLYRGNGVNYMKYQPSTCVFTNLGINSLPSEVSDWAVSDVIIFSRELSLSEIQTVEASLTRSHSVAPTYTPTTTSTLSPSTAQPTTNAPTTITPTTLSPTKTLSPTTASTVVINNLVTTLKFLNLAEVQLFKNGVQIPRDSLSFTLSSTFVSNKASNCNDGITATICHSESGGVDPNPTLTIVSAAAFDKVVVYNREDCCQERIIGATITATVNGQSQATTFRNSAGVFTFLLSSSGLELYRPSGPISSDRLFAKYSASSDITGGIWPDISGNQNHATVSGTVLTGTDEFGTPIITGDPSTSIQFPVGGIGDEYTIIYRAKYNGPNKNRILTTDTLNGCNWLSGFWGGRVGVAFHADWITENIQPPHHDDWHPSDDIQFPPNDDWFWRPPSDDNWWQAWRQRKLATAKTQELPVDQWLVSTDQLYLYRGNGVDYTRGHPSACVSTNIGINLLASERSDWALSDMIIYSRELSLSEIQFVEALLI